MASVIRDYIVTVVDRCGGQVAGIFDLAFREVGTQNMTWFRKQLHSLEQDGTIEITNAPQRGRGHKKTIKLNRNSPGYSRLHHRG